MTTTAAPPDDWEWLLDPDLTEEEFTELVLGLTGEDREALAEQIANLRPPPEPWEPHPYQIPPPLTEPWQGWLLMGGRGIGKTATITHWLNDHMNGPPCLQGPIPHRAGMFAPTLGDVSASLVNGEDGLKVINPAVEEKTLKGGTVVRWPNGGIAYEFGTNTVKDVDRCRAHTNRCVDIYEEIAAWPQLRYALDQAALGLRRGLMRWVGATTPRPRHSIIRLDKDPTVRKSRARTADNTALPEERRREYYEMFAGTHLEAQELEGKIVAGIEGALWTQELIDENRVGLGDVPPLQALNVYVDPSWGTTGDECGIIVAGLGIDKHIYILADLSRRASPETWATVALLGYQPPKDADPATLHPREWYGRRPRYIVHEANFQGQQVIPVIKLAALTLRRRALLRPVNAKVNKRLRAEPALLLYEKNRVHHVNPQGRTFTLLEHEMTTWVPPKPGQDQGDPGDPPPPTPEGEPQQTSDWSPNRLDATVYAILHLALSGLGMKNPSPQAQAITNAIRIQPTATPITPPKHFPIPPRKPQHP